MESGFNSRKNKNYLFSLQYQHWDSPRLLSNEYQNLPGLEPSGREADHLFPSVAKIKNTRVYTPTLPYNIMSQRLIHYAKGQLFFNLPALTAEYFGHLVKILEIKCISF